VGFLSLAGDSHMVVNSILLAFIIARGVAVIVASAEMIRGRAMGAFIGAITIVSALIGCQFANAPAWSSMGAVGLGIYVAVRAVAGDVEHIAIHNFAVAIAAFLGTSFREADLTNTNFSPAQLNNADFRKALKTKKTNLPLRGRFVFLVFGLMPSV
jgi:hypothetical protein